MKVKVEQKNKAVILKVSDNGVGIDANQLSGRSSLGLLGMRERARLVGGTLRILSGRGNGTQVVARLPLDTG